MHRCWVWGALVAVSACVDVAFESDAPAWVSNGAWSERGATAEHIYAVGEARHVRNPSLARTTAGARARSALVRHLQVKGATIAVVRLRGVSIIEHWVDAKNGTVYALAELKRPLRE